MPAPHFTPPKAPFVLLVLAVLAAGFVGLLLLNTSLQQGAFAAGRLDDRAVELRQQTESLERQVLALRAPEALGTRASELGMVPVPNPAFLRLSDGAVLGEASVAVAGTGPQILPLPPEPPAPPAPQPGTEPLPPGDTPPPLDAAPPAAGETAEQAPAAPPPPPPPPAPLAQ